MMKTTREELTAIWDRCGNSTVDGQVQLPYLDFERLWFDADALEAAEKRAEKAEGGRGELRAKYDGAQEAITEWHAEVIKLRKALESAERLADERGRELEELRTSIGRLATTICNWETSKDNQLADMFDVDYLENPEQWIIGKLQALLNPPATETNSRASAHRENMRELERVMQDDTEGES